MVGKRLMVVVFASVERSNATVAGSDQRMSFPKYLFPDSQGALKVI